MGNETNEMPEEKATTLALGVTHRMYSQQPVSVNMRVLQDILPIAEDHNVLDYR